MRKKDIKELNYKFWEQKVRYKEETFFTNNYNHLFHTFYNKFFY